MKVHHFVILATTVVLGSVPACRSSSATPPTDARLQGEQRSSEAVRRRLEDMVDLFTAAFVDAADDIASSSANPTLQRRMIVGKTRIIPSARAVLQSENPLDGLIDLWVMAVQFRRLFDSAEGVERFGDDVRVAVDAATTVADAIGAEVRGFVGEGNFEQARADVERFASENPMAADLTRRGLLPSDKPSASRGGVFSWVPTINLDPFGGVGEGISEGAAAIQAFAVVADRFTTVVDTIPDRVEWSLELFAHDFAYNPAIVELNQSTGTVAASIDRIATTTESLPADIRREVTMALEVVDPKLAEVQRTLVDAQAAAASLEQAAAAFTATAQAMEPMASQLDTTLGTFHDLMTYLNGDVDAAGVPRPPSPPPSPDAPPKRPFDILDFEKTATSIAAMAAELRATVTELHGLVGDPVIPQRLGEVGGTTQASVRAVVVDATVGALVVLVAFFVLLYGYRRVSAPRSAS